MSCSYDDLFDVRDIQPEDILDDFDLMVELLFFVKCMLFMKNLLLRD